LQNSQPVQMIAPGEDMRPGHLPELLGAANAGKRDELLDIPLVIVAGVTVAQIGEPLGFRGDGGEGLELCRGETVERNLCKCSGGHGPLLC